MKYYMKLKDGAPSQGIISFIINPDDAPENRHYDKEYVVSNELVGVTEEQYNNIEFCTWDGTSVTLDEDSMNKQKALEECYSNRKAEYGTMESQLDEMFHDGFDSWKERIQAVKDKYPKPE